MLTTKIEGNVVTLRTDVIAAWILGIACMIALGWAYTTVWCRVTLGFFVSVIVGAVLLDRLVNKYLWTDYFRERELPHPSQKSRTWLVGCVERLLYTTAILIGAWLWIAIWMTVKVALKWRSWPEDRPDGISDNIWLIGTGLSVAFGFLGAWIALGFNLPSIH